jgi:hypothetical protein
VDEPSTGGALALADLRDGVEIGLLRGESLLTTGERRVAARIAALTGMAGELYARLVGRKPKVFAIDVLEHDYGDLGDAIRTLTALGLVDGLVSWAQRAEASTVDALREGCGRCGLSTRGARPALVQRLRGQVGWSSRVWLRVRHRGLLRRLWIFATLSRREARSREAVLERIGVRRWPDYALTSPPGAAVPLWFADREELLAWEQLDPEAMDADAALDALGRARPLARGLDVRRALRDRVLALALIAERDRQPAVAVQWYDRMAELGWLSAEGEVRRALAREASGDRAAAFDRLAAALATSTGPRRLALLRTLRRLGRDLRRGVPPDPPLRRPPERELRLSAAPGDLRPRYKVNGQTLAVEDAVIARLDAIGRRALHAEGALWTTLFALILADLYFLPIAGALPVPRLAGPLDLGTPSFADARAPQLTARLAEVAAGQAAGIVAAADTRWRGVELAGASWSFSSSDLVIVATAMPGPALASLLRAIATRGWSAASGLPDLVVLPGPEVSVPSSFPSRLSSGMVLAECKGPTDAVRDAQAWWFDALLGWRVSVELWWVRHDGAGAERL